jgi:hypothetical protein
MSQTVGKFLSVLIVIGFDARLEETIGCNIERPDPVLALPVVDIVPSVGVDQFRKTDFVIVVETNSFLQFDYVSRTRFRRKGEIEVIGHILRRKCKTTSDFPYWKGIGFPSSLFIAISIESNSRQPPGT